MSTLTIRNLDERVKRELRKRAAEHGVSMEQEVRDILARSVAAAGGRRKPTIEELTRLGIKPEQPFDLKGLSDEMWDEGLS
jgi:plasmid stability protein